MQDLQLKMLGEFLAVGEDLLEIHDQSHPLVELVMQELEDLKNILADRHLLSLVMKHSKNILLNLHFLLIIFIRSQRNQREPNGCNFFDMQKHLLRSYVEASLLFDCIIHVSVDQSLIDLGLSKLINPGKRKHLVILLQDLLIVEMLVYDVRDAIAEVYEIADNEQFQHMFVEILIEELFLVCPVQDQNSCLLEVNTIVVLTVVLEELIDEMLLIKEGLMPMQSYIAFHHPDVIKHHL